MTAIDVAAIILFVAIASRLIHKADGKRPEFQFLHWCAVFAMVIPVYYLTEFLK